MAEGRQQCVSPEEGGGNTENHRAILMARVSAVVHITYDLAVRGHYGACSGGGNSEEEHHLTAQELSYTGAQNFSAISLSNEGQNSSDLIMNINLCDSNHKQKTKVSFFNIICSFRRSAQLSKRRGIVLDYLQEYFSPFSNLLNVLGFKS